MDAKEKLDLSLDELIALNRSENDKKVRANDKPYNPIRRNRRNFQLNSKNSTKVNTFDSNEPLPTIIPPPPPPYSNISPFYNEGLFYNDWPSGHPYKERPFYSEIQYQPHPYSNYQSPMRYLNTKMLYPGERGRPRLYKTPENNQINFCLTGIQGLNKEELKVFLQNFGQISSIDFPAYTPNIAFVNYLSSSLTKIKKEGPTSITFKGVQLTIEPSIQKKVNSSTPSSLNSFYPRSKVIPLKSKEMSNTFIPKESIYFQNLPTFSEQNSTNITQKYYSSNPSPSASIVITNVPIELSAQEIEEAFSTVGKIIKTDLLLDSMGNPTGRIAMVFENLEAAQEAVKRYNGGALNNQIIRVFLEDFVS